MFLVLAIGGVWTWALYPEKPERNAARPVAESVPESAKRSGARTKKGAVPRELRAALAAADADFEDDASATSSSGLAGGAARPRTRAPVYVDAGAMKAVMAFAKEDGACRRGHTAACNDLDAAGGRVQLARFEAKLEGGCSAGQLSACRQRGDLDLAGGDLEKGATWYKKLRLAANTVASRCSDHLETRPTVCKEAVDALRTAANKDAELQKLRLAH